MRLEELPTNEDWQTGDWKEVFSLDNSWKSSPSQAFAATMPTHKDPVAVPTLDEVERVVCWQGRNLEGGGSVEVIAVLRLTGDDRYAFVDAGADYTGWGCRDYTTFHVGTWQEVWHYAVTLDDAVRMGVADKLGVRMKAE